MLVKTLLPALALTLVVTAAPPKAKRATCTNGQTTNDASCCIWFDVLDDLQSDDGLFGGTCGADAHEALRLTFHDAISYSPTLGGGGADGSILAWSDIELEDPLNDGMDSIIEGLRPLAIKYNVSFGDIIQFAGAVGLSNCQGGPQLQFLAGRSNDSSPAPAGLIPGPADTADSILSRMSDAGFTANEVVDLLASHSIAFQTTVDTSATAAVELDSTPTVFDAQFFVETLLKGTVGNTSVSGEAESFSSTEFRLVSDSELARDNRTACEWQSFVDCQDCMVSAFIAAMAKMAVLGQDASTLTDCSDVIPTSEAYNATAATLPAGTSLDDIEASCASTPFPSLAVASS